MKKPRKKKKSYWSFDRDFVLSRIAAHMVEAYGPTILDDDRLSEIGEHIVATSDQLNTEAGIEEALAPIEENDVLDLRLNRWLRSFLDDDDDVVEAIANDVRDRYEPYETKLYWVETDDHDEDWFVIAHSASDAQHFHEDYEGYGTGDATAIYVAHYPCDDEGPDVPAHPKNKDLKHCGGVRMAVHPNASRTAKEKAAATMMGVVEESWRFGDRIFAAGNIIKNVADSEQKNEGESLH